MYSTTYCNHTDLVCNWCYKIFIVQKILAIIKIIPEPKIPQLNENKWVNTKFIVQKILAILKIIPEPKIPYLNEIKWVNTKFEKL